MPDGVQPLPPGCLSMSCAHQRAPEFYAESVYPGNENNFLGVRCNSLHALTSNYCPGGAFPMGYATPHNLKGNYFLKTNEESPYGLNATQNAKPNCFENANAIASNQNPILLKPTPTRRVQSASDSQTARLRSG